MGRFELSTRTTDTGGQRAVAEAVRELGLMPGMEQEFPPYFVDVYIGEAHVGIEYDGPGWHSLGKRDRERDSFLMENYFLPILRVETDKTAELVPLIKEFVDRWAPNAKRRKEKCYLGSS